MKKLWVWLTHKHDYVQVGFKQAEDAHERYSIRKYECQSCKKVKWIDGRLDDYYKHN